MHTLYDATIPGFIRGLRNLKDFLEKGRAWAEEKGIGEAALIAARLAPDMHALPAQIQRASDAAKGLAVRLGDAEPVAMADDETSFAALADRIDRTIAVLESLSREAFDGKEDAAIELKTPSRTMHFTGADYAQGFAVPNFWFHVTIAYAILRNQGVPLGKMDFLRGV